MTSTGRDSTATRMSKLRADVFVEWEARVRKDLPQADRLSSPILIDTLPAFYDNIVSAISRGHGDVEGVAKSLAEEHGGERARLTAYGYQSLVDEFQLFRQALFDVMHARGVEASHAERGIINTCIDAAIRESVNGFTLVHNGLRERFAIALAHDMRGPLSIAMSALELGMITRDPARSQAMTMRAMSQLQRMDAMIAELLHSMSFTQGEPMKMALSHFNMMELVNEVQLDAIALSGRRVVVAGGPVSGWWGRNEMRRAIENMLANAFKYGRPEGTATIGVVEAYGRLILSVHNDGDPIPVHEQESIFQMYRRAEAALVGQSEGWGIGLPYVRSVAESHGGSVGVTSTADAGTTFLIDVPVDCRALNGAPTLSA